VFEVRAGYSEHLKEIREKLRAKLAEQQENLEELARKRTNRGPSAGRIRSDMERLEKQYMTGQFLGKKERDFHKKMKQLSEALKEATKTQGSGGMRELKDSVRDAERLQEDAHKSVEKAVMKAQEAHDLMVELSEEVDRLREKANTAHTGLTRSKREADMLHGQYIVSLRCIHSIQDMMKAMELREKKEEDSEGGEKLELADLMSRLMSGDTLSTDELMAIPGWVIQAEGLDTQALHGRNGRLYGIE
jgi:uncharacterized coiled-coil DUF342 family protein